MLTTPTYLKILYCNDPDLDEEISKISDSDAKQILKTMVQFIHAQGIDENDLIQFWQEQTFPI